MIPAFAKPLIEINGRRLFDHALAEADCWGADEVVTVVSPHNAYDLHCSTAWQVEQVAPTGVLDALRLALTRVTRPTTVILCADNLFEGGPPASNLACFGARSLRPAATLRFTRYKRYQGRTLFYPRDAPPSLVTDGCWIGPVRCSTAALRKSLVEPDLTLHMLLYDLDLIPWPMRCADLGVTEESL